MNSKWLAIAGVSILSFACNLQQAAAPEMATQDMPSAKLNKKQAKAGASQVETASKAKPRRVGDYFVHRFSGSYRDSALTLTEEVVGKEASLLVVDYTLEDGEATFKLRARIDEAKGKVVRVSEFDGGEEVDAPLSAYETLLAKTLFAPDINEGLVSEETQTCLVGPEELNCETKNYRVFVGDDEALLKVTRTDDLPGRDVAGEVATSDGSIIYRAELVEAGHHEGSMPTVAQIPEAYQE